MDLIPYLSLAGRITYALFGEPISINQIKVDTNKNLITIGFHGEYTSPDTLVLAKKWVFPGSDIYLYSFGESGFGAHTYDKPENTTNPLIAELFAMPDCVVYSYYIWDTADQGMKINPDPSFDYMHEDPDVP